MDFILKKQAHFVYLLFYESGNVLLSRAVSHQVSSALKSLTTVFGMGTGVSSSLLSPHLNVLSRSSVTTG